MILECSVPKNQTNAPFPSSTIVLWQTKAPFPTNGFSLFFVHEISLSLFEANLFSPHQESFQQHFTQTTGGPDSQFRSKGTWNQRQTNWKVSLNLKLCTTHGESFIHPKMKRLRIQSGNTNWRSVFVVWGPGYQTDIILSEFLVV